MPLVRRPHRGLALLAALALPLAAFAQTTYDVKVDTLLDGADVKVEHTPYDGMLIVTLENIGAVRARCELVFDASPQVLSRKTKFIAPGKKVTSELRATRTWFSVHVDVKCTAAPK
jgi:hypothetical protein